jgi:hypothetical protein
MGIPVENGWRRSGCSPTHQRREALLLERVVERGGLVGVLVAVADRDLAIGG